MEGDWNRVGGRKLRRNGGGVRWDIVKKEISVAKCSVSTIFITDFRDKWNARDLFMEFKDLGVIEEIVLPPKRDWRGQRFGFVRFINVEDEKFLETKMDNIWLDGCKLRANISKIKRKEPKTILKYASKNSIGQNNLSGEKQSFLLRNDKESIIRKGNESKGGEGTSRTFADVIRGEKGPNAALNSEANKSLFYSSSADEKSRFAKAKVGVTRCVGSAYCVAQSLWEEGIFTVSATALGPNLCLLEESNEGDLKALLEEGGVWRAHWFKEVRDWRNTDAECTRMTSVSIYGAPCYVKTQKFFDILLADIGTIVNPETLKDKSTRLDVTNIMIYTGYLEMIRNKVKACIDGNWFEILIIEEAMPPKDDSEGSFSVNGSSSGFEAASSSPDNSDDVALSPRHRSKNRSTTPRELGRNLDADGDRTPGISGTDGDRSGKVEGEKSYIDCKTAFEEKLSTYSDKLSNTDPC